MKAIKVLFSVWISILIPIHLLGQENDQAVLIIHGMDKKDLDQRPNLSMIEFGIVNNRVNELIRPQVQGSKAIYRLSNLEGDKVFQISRSVSFNLSTVPFYFITPGDSINIFINKDQVLFAGVGHEKFEILYALNRIRQERPKNDYNWISRFQIQENLSVLNLQESYLIEHKHLISDSDFYNILNETRLYNQMENYWLLGLISNDNGDSTNLINQLYELDAKINKNLESCFYTSYIIGKYEFDEVKLKGLKFDFNTAFNYIVANYQGLMKEALLTNLISNRLRSLSVTQHQFLILNSFTNDRLRSYIDILTKGRIDGSKAPSFSLTGIDGKEFSSKKISGKVIVMDFWFTGCGACLEIPPILGPIAEKYKDSKDVIFLSISIDKDMKKWKESVKKGGYTFNHSLHLFTGGHGRNHPIMTDFTVGGCPTILLISKSGEIISIADSIRNDNGKSLELALTNELN